MWIATHRFGLQFVCVCACYSYVCARASLFAFVSVPVCTCVHTRRPQRVNQQVLTHVSEPGLPAGLPARRKKLHQWLNARGHVSEAACNHRHAIAGKGREGGREGWGQWWRMTIKRWELMSRNKRDISQVGKSERLKKRKDSEVSLFFFLSLWNLLITFTSPPVPPFALVPKFVPALATLLLSFSSLTSISPSFTWPSSPSPSLPSVPPSLSPLPITRRSMSRTAHFTAFKCWREILLGIIQQEMNPQMLLTPSHTPPPLRHLPSPSFLPPCL